MSTLHGTAACLLTLLSITVALMLTRGGETQPNRTQERFMRDSAISGPYSLIIVDLPMPSPSTTQATRTIREDLCFFECDLWLKLCCRSDRPGSTIIYIYHWSLMHAVARPHQLDNYRQELEDSADLSSIDFVIRLSIGLGMVLLCVSILCCF